MVNYGMLEMHLLNKLLVTLITVFFKSLIKKAKTR